MEYIVGESIQSKPFTSFVHKMSDIITGLVKNNLSVTLLEEYDYDIGGGFCALNGKGFPLSYVLTAEKR